MSVIQEDSRYVSRLTQQTLALILAGGRGSRLGHLTEWRAKPAVPFGGKFRIIDFPLSNCVNSGIRQIGVLTQYKAHSLLRHIQKGWNFFRGEFGEFVELLPAQQRLETDWYLGTADAIYQNLDIIRSLAPEYILVLAGDHIYKMDYGGMLAHHVEMRADFTVGCIEVPVKEATGFGVMSVDEQYRVTKFSEKPENPEPLPHDSSIALASMGIYVFNTHFLMEQLIRDADNKNSSHDFGKDIIPHMISRGYRAFAYPFRDESTGIQVYWRDVGTIDAYYEANMELVKVLPELNLYDNNWPIWTYQEQLPPAKFVFDYEEKRGLAVDSMVSGGCIISGAKVHHSLLFSKVVVEQNSLVQSSVILPNVTIGANCVVRNAIIDKGCVVPDGTQIGMNKMQDEKLYSVTPKGVVLVTPEMLGQQVHHAR